MRSKISLSWIILLAILIAIVVHPYFQVGVPDTHDGNNHLVRFASYKIAVKEGQFPPRWAPNLLDYYGYPVFNYNYPLANILSLPFSILKIHYEVTFKILVVTFLFLGAFSLKSWLTLLSKSKTGVNFGVIAWLFLPFLVSTIYFRGNIGEILAYCLIPFVLYVIEFINQNKVSLRTATLFSIGITAFLLSHNLTVVFFLPLLLVYALVRFGIDIAKWKWLTYSLILGVATSLWFWLPALAELQFVTVASSDLSKDYVKHFATVSQLTLSPLSFGYSYPGSVDGLSFNVGIVTVVSIFLGILVYLSKAANKILNKTDSLLIYFSVAGLLLVFLQTNYSEFIWRMFGFAQLIQFPWRLSVYLGVVVAVLVTLLWNEGKVIKSLLVTTLIVALIQIIRLQPISLLHLDRNSYDAQTIATSTLLENKPRTFWFETFSPEETWTAAPKFLNGEGSSTPIKWNGSNRSYLLEVTQTARIVEPTANFPGWETYVTSDGNKQKVSYIDDNEIDGRIAYSLEPGQYQVQTIFTQNTWPRMVGNAISSISLFSLALILFLKRKDE